MPQYIRKDPFYHKAKEEGYVSRSAYKLIEMDQRFHIFNKGTRYIDLGSSPGGWLQVAQKQLDERRSDYELPSRNSPLFTFGATQPMPCPVIIGIDLNPLKFKPGGQTLFVQGNFLDASNQIQIAKNLGGKADWILSDLSPNISGIKFKDLDASLALCESAFEFAKMSLRMGGNLLMKIFPGPEMEEFKKKIKNNFSRLSTFIPDATRKSSIEIYLLGLSFKSTSTV